MVKWRRGGTSGNIEDRRGQGIGKGGVAGLGGGAGLLILIVSVLLRGGDGGDAIQKVLEQFDATPGSIDPADDKLVEEMSAALDDIQVFWTTALPEQTGVDYRDAKLVLFTDAVSTGCGNASSETGPFYCPPDERAYLDLSFFRELADQFGAPGDFARAYVLAHELGHHVQTITDAPRGNGNAGSITYELQADCLAGVWAHDAQDRGLFEKGDLDEGLKAAASVGDDRIQSQAGVEVNKETWTHGSAEQRVASFRHGFDAGDVAECRLRS
jgi:predicted metalloprotease